MTDAERKKREREAALLLLLLIRLMADLDETADDFAAGTISAGQFGGVVTQYLYDTHLLAAAVGRRVANIGGPIDDGDILIATGAMDEDKSFLEQFVNDLKNGRYRVFVDKSGNMVSVENVDEVVGEHGLGGIVIDVEAIKSRLKLYAEGVAGTANESWVENLPDETMFAWVDVKDKAECFDCVNNAANSPYSKLDLPSVPGDGQTQCLMNCRCQLVIIGGPQSGQKSVDLRHLFDGAELTM